jgi:hypothetical protein
LLSEGSELAGGARAFGDRRSDGSPVAQSVGRDEGRRREAAQGTRGGEPAAEADRRTPCAAGRPGRSGAAGKAGRVLASPAAVGVRRAHRHLLDQGWAINRKRRQRLWRSGCLPSGRARNLPAIDPLRQRARADFGQAVPRSGRTHPSSRRAWLAARSQRASLQRLPQTCPCAGIFYSITRRPSRRRHRMHVRRDER